MSKKKLKKADLYENEDFSIAKEDAVDKVLKDFKSDEDSRSDREKIWRNADSMYYGNLKPKSDPWINCSNFAHPMPRTICDTLTDNLSHSFPTAIDLIKPVPVSNDDHLKANKRGQFLNYQFKQEIKWDDIKQDLFQIAVRYGDCFTKQYYDIIQHEKSQQEIENEISQIQPDEQGNFPEIDPMITDFHGVRMDIVNIEDIYKPGDSIGVQQDTCSHIIHRVRLSRPDYERRVANQGYSPIDFEENKVDNGNPLSLNMDNDEKRKKQIGISNSIKDTEYYVNLLEWYGAFYNEQSDTWTESVIVVHPQSRTVSKAYINKLGFRPFVQHSPRCNANQPYHEGIPEVVRQIAHYLNTVYNQRRDSETKRISQPGFYDKGAGFNPKNYLMKPNTLYPVSGSPSSAVYFPNFQGAPPELFNEEQILSQMVESLTGISKSIEAAMSQGDKSATEIATVTNKFNIRFESIFTRFERSIMEVVLQINDLNRMYMPSEKEYRVLGNNGKYRYDSIKSSDLSDRFDIIFKGNSVANEMVEQQKAMQVYQLGVGSPLIANNAPYLYTQLKRLYEALHVDRIDELIPVPVQALTRTPEEENELMYKGIQVPVQLNENAEEHWAQHQQEMDQIGWREKVEPFIQACFIQHVNSTNTLKAVQITAKMSGTQSTVGPSAINPGNTAPAAPVGGAPAKPIQR